MLSVLHAVQLEHYRLLASTLSRAPSYIWALGVLDLSSSDPSILLDVSSRGDSSIHSGHLVMTMVVVTSSTRILGSSTWSLIASCSTYYAMRSSVHVLYAPHYTLYVCGSILMTHPES